MDIMTANGMMLGVYHLPKIEVDTGFDWLTFSGFILTLVTVLAGTYVTVASYKKTLRSQEELARRVSLKESRQQWINQFRDCCADYVSHLLVLNLQCKEQPTRQALLATVINKDPGAAVQIVHEMGVSLKSIRLSTYALRARIILLANLKETEFQRLLIAVDKAISVVEDDVEVLSHCTEITAIAQVILKNEWERAKRLE